MRIAYVASMKRGLPSFIYREIQELIELGTEVVLFTTKRGKGLYMPRSEWKVYPLLRPGRIAWGQMLTFLSSPAKYLCLLFEAARSRSLVHFVAAAAFAPAMKQTQVQMIYCQEALHSLFIGYYCKHMLKLPLLVMIHADGLYIGERWPIFTRALAACDHILTVSDHNRGILIDRFGVEPQRVQVVRLFVDHESFRPDDRVSIMIVGQFSKRKGHDLLLQAVKTLNRADLVVWVVGEGTWGIGDYVDVRELADELDMKDQVIFFGSVSEDTLRTLYRACDIFCLPSRTFIVKEGLPVSLIEAMASARPVISTRHAGIPELVPDILVEEEDVEGVAQAIAYLADHPDVRRRMGERNRNIIIESYSRDNVKRLRDAFLSEIACTRGQG
jgi:glycosyltransferase involved in cell wall biosynthesis